MEKFFGVRPTTDEKRLAWKVAAFYAAAAGLWFFLSDRFLAILAREPEATTWLHILNDWLYVLVTAVLLGWLVRRQVRVLRREDELMRAMAQGISVAAGEAFFTSLTRNLAETLEMEAAFLCEASGSPQALRTVAAHLHGRDTGALELDPTGALFPRVLREGAVRYPQRAREGLTGIPLLEELPAECFFGIPLIGSGGRTLGLLAVADTQPLREAEAAEAVLSVFAVRAAIELERLQEEAQLRQEKDFFVELAKALPAFLAVIGPDGRVRMANEQLLQAAGQIAELVVGREFLAALVPEEERPPLAARLGTLTDRVEPVRIESHLLTGDGRRLPVTWRLRAQLTAEGKPDYIIALGTEAAGAAASDGMP
jgi:PAS domain S-box-containing protein